LSEKLYQDVFIINWDADRKRWNFIGYKEPPILEEGEKYHITLKKGDYRFSRQVKYEIIERIPETINHCFFYKSSSPSRLDIIGTQKIVEGDELEGFVKLIRK
jgi:hypothetical protein